MKEAVSERGGGNGSGRSAVERERTKMRERHRRSITTNIFHGLRKHGGYRLSPRADINEVLRHLAKEAGWIVEPDGTTYRSADVAATTTTTISNVTSACPLCGGGRKSAPATPSCSLLGGGGECSTSTSPRRVAGGDAAVNNLPSTSVMDRNDTLLAIYMSGSVAPPLDGCASDAAAYGNEEQQQQQLYLLHEATVSNQSTPAGSP